MAQRMFRFKDLNVQLNVGGIDPCVDRPITTPGCLCTSDPVNDIIVSYTCRFGSTIPPKFCTGFSDIEIVPRKILTSPEARALLRQSLEQDLKVLAELDAAQNAPSQPGSLEEAEMLRSKLSDALKELDAQITELKKKG